MSSGNLTADRRFDYARMLQADGDHAGAAELIAQALELAPDWAEAHFALGEARALAGDADGAKAAYRAYLTQDPADSMGAAARLALLHQEIPTALPAAYVRRLFDEYAPRFDKALVEGLHYRAPALLRAAVDKLGRAHFGRAFDLGCGTGLCGAAFRNVADWLGGVDLSPGMIKQTAATGLYDHLECGDMIAALNALPEKVDLVLAADVLVYVGDLAPVFQAVATKLAPASGFAFTLQRSDGQNIVFGAEQRFSHSRDYVRRAARDADLAVALLEDVVSRQEKGIDVPGLLVVLRRA